MAILDPTRWDDIPRETAQRSVPAGEMRYRHPVSNEPRMRSEARNSHSEKPAPPGWRKSPQFVALMALAISAIAAAVAFAPWISAGVYHWFGSQKTAEARTKVCAAYAAVNKAVSAGNLKLGPDPIAATAVAANARLALIGGGAYLRDLLDDEPSTPDGLAKAVSSLASTLEQLGLSYIAMEPAGAQAPLRADLETEIGEINKFCA